MMMMGCVYVEGGVGDLRVGKANGIGHVEHEREEDNWDEAARGEGGAESMSISSGQDQGRKNK